MTRPKFKIDPKQLRILRDGLRLTQLEVAKRVHKILGTKTTEKTNDASLVTIYQRIERTGDTSKARAVALAEVLGTTVEILQGGDGPEDSADFVSRLAQQLREQKASGNNPVLERALDQYVKTYEHSIDEDDCIRGFATDIGVQIEVAQIGQNAIEIARLSTLTGWSEAQLRQSGSVRGHWLLLTTVHRSRKTEIVLGTNEVMYRIRDTFEKWTKWHDSDARITLRRALPWFHVDIFHPLIAHRRCTFSFVRCQPEISGLKWVNPHWRDTFWLEEPLAEWAFSKANLVTDFDEKSRPEDVRRLRFRVLEHGAKGAIQRVAHSKGDLDELPGQVFQNFEDEGNSHALVINWLAAGLARSLKPLLAAYSPEYWRISGGTYQIAIFLELPYRLLRANSDSTHCNGIRYSIGLVEETSPGDYRPAPWRESSVAEVTRLLEERVFEKCDAFDGEEALQFLSLPDSPN